MLSEAAVTRFSFYASWGILLVLFVCAYVQGPDFASTKESSTVFGCAIGVAAFFSWLAVVNDEMVANATARHDQAIFFHRLKGSLASGTVPMAGDAMKTGR